MREQSRDREILRRLADRLPENLLRELFPDREPEAIRDALRRTSGTEAPTANKGTAPPLPFSRPDGQPVSPAAQPGDSCFLYTDGASRGNPGEAGAGAVLLDGDRRQLASLAIYLGQCTNNVAEYRALLAGLELALQHGCDRLNIFLDSELIVRQISGQYKVKNSHLQPLYLQARGLLQQLRSWRIKHVPRAENAKADQLANQGIDEKNHSLSESKNNLIPMPENTLTS
jgi:ribonuclease HI/probable phosphoglycerate mutase